MSKEEFDVSSQQLFSSSLSLPYSLSGKVLHECQLSQCVMQVREDEHWRWLIFNNSEIVSACGSVPLQSVMLRSNTRLLILPYMQAMCAGLAFLPAKKSLSILQVGLGAGAINRFLDRLPNISSLCTVEKESSVIDVYREYFRLDEPTISEQIIHQSSEGYLGQDITSQYDYIFFDLFDTERLQEPIFFSDTFVQLRQYLKPDGVIAINLPIWNKSDLTQMFIMFRKVFSHAVFASVPGHKNLIIYLSDCALSFDKKQISLLEQHLNLKVQDYLETAIDVDHMA